MKILPQAIAPYFGSAEVSLAETKVFHAFQDMGNFNSSSRCYHSLNLTDHDYKEIGEADFVLVSSLGILILEVKGGGVSYSSSTGFWQTCDRKGKNHTLKESPFRQAQSAMYAVKKRLSKLIGEDVVRNIPFGWGVIIPDCSADSIDIEAMEWPRELLLDGDSLLSGNALSAAQGDVI